jgi:hypothetical protein
MEEGCLKNNNMYEKIAKLFKLLELKTKATMVFFLSLIRITKIKLTRKENIINLGIKEGWKGPREYLKNNKSLLFLCIVYISLSFLFFSYISIYKLNSIVEGRSAIVNYYLLQFQFIKSIKTELLSFVGASIIILLLYLRFYIKNKSIKKLFFFYFIIIIVSIVGFNFAYLGIRAFAIGDVLVEKIKIDKNHQSEDIYWDTDEIINKLNSKNDPPKIIKGEDNISKQTILFILNTKNRSYFYKQQILPATLNFFSPKIAISENSTLVMVGNNILVRKFDTDVLEKISPILAMLIVEKETDYRYIKNDSDMHLMGRQEYTQFREDQINSKIARIEDALTEVTKIVNTYYSAVADDKSNINYNISMANSMISKGDYAYSSCINAQISIPHFMPGTCTYYYCSSGYTYYTYEPRYSYSYCSSQQDFYYNLSDGYVDNANDWRDQLQSDQYELSVYEEIKEIIEIYDAMAVASKEDIPFELGIFNPPNSIKIAIDSTKIETLADYFSTVVHEYFHYTSYISDEKSLPTFFEEGLTEYFAREAIINNMGIETNEGYPLIVKVVERMMEKISEKDFQNIYFTKDINLLSTTLDNAFGKDFSKDNALYFEFISYLPPKDALEITNKMLDKIGIQELTEEDLLSKNSEF